MRRMRMRFACMAEKDSFWQKSRGTASASSQISKPGVTTEQTTKRKRNGMPQSTVSVTIDDR